MPTGTPCEHTSRSFCVVLKKGPAALMGRRHIGIQEILWKWFPPSLFEFCTDEGQYVLSRIFRFTRVTYLLPSILIFKYFGLLANGATTKEAEYFSPSALCPKPLDSTGEGIPEQQRPNQTSADYPSSTQPSHLIEVYHRARCAWRVRKTLRYVQVTAIPANSAGHAPGYEETGQLKLEPQW